MGKITVKQVRLTLHHGANDYEVLERELNAIREDGQRIINVWHDHSIYYTVITEAENG